MTMAIDEARRSVGEDERAHPKVGAIVVKDGTILATAYRGEMGKGEHAEYTALEKKLRPTRRLPGQRSMQLWNPAQVAGIQRHPCSAAHRPQGEASDRDA